MVIYEGIFFDKNIEDKIKRLEAKLGIKLENDVSNLHCTFKYKPDNDEIFNDIVGKRFEIELLGYGSDGKNSGFIISLPCELYDYYINFDDVNTNKLKIPHITTSLGVDGKAVDTKNLNFIYLENPIKINGRFGYFLDTKEVSYEPFIIKKIY